MRLRGHGGEVPLALRLSVPDAQELCPQPVITCDTHRRTGEVTPAGLQATGEQDLALNSPPCDLKAGEPIRFDCRLWAKTEAPGIFRGGGAEGEEERLRQTPPHRGARRGPRS